MEIKCPHCDHTIVLNEIGGQLIPVVDFNAFFGGRKPFPPKIKEHLISGLSESTYNRLINSDVEIDSSILDIFVFDLEDYILNKLSIAQLASDQVDRWCVENEVPEVASDPGLSFIGLDDAPVAKRNSRKKNK